MERTYSAKVLEDAKEQAYREFEAEGADRDDVIIEVLEQPVKKLFSTKGEYKISARWEDPNEIKESLQANQPVEEFSEFDHDDPAFHNEKVNRARVYLHRVLVELGVKGFDINLIKRGDMVVLNIEGDDLGIVIGRRGETLDALQYLTILAGNKSLDNCYKISIDCCGYREKRKSALEALAVKTSRKVLKTGRRITLEPMNPYERRIIHSKVAEIDGVTSRSTGEEPFRKVAISSTEPRRGNRQHNRSYSSYRQSSGFSTSFEREYKRREAPAPKAADYSEETAELEKSASLYGKIEL